MGRKHPESPEGGWRTALWIGWFVFTAGKLAQSGDGDFIATGSRTDRAGMIACQALLSGDAGWRNALEEADVLAHLHHPSDPRRAPATRPDARKAAQAVTSAARLARSADCARFCLSPIRTQRPPISTKRSLSRAELEVRIHLPPADSQSLAGIRLPASRS